MNRVVTCPKCGRILCRASSGSKVELRCHICKIDVLSKIDISGCVHVLESSDNANKENNKP